MIHTLSIEAYKKICTCANMCSDLTVVINDTSVSTDNTWSSQKVAQEIFDAKEEIKKYIAEDDLVKLDINVVNALPSLSKLHENTLYIEKVFNEFDYTIVDYYKLHMKFGDKIISLGDSGISYDSVYTKEEADDLFLTIPKVEIDNQRGVSTAAIYNVISQNTKLKVVPDGGGNGVVQEVVPITCKRKNNVDDERFVMAVNNFTDKIAGNVTYKVINDFCVVDFNIRFLANNYTSKVLDYKILNQGFLPVPTLHINHYGPFAYLTSENEDCNVLVNCWISSRGEVFVNGCNDQEEDIISENDIVFKGSLIYSIV
jgi:hypothetical protein